MMKTSPLRVVLALATAVLLLGLCIFLFWQRSKVPTVDFLPPGELLSPEGRALLPEGVQLRAVYQPGINLTKSSEGWVPHLYNDAVGYCTIGYGHLIGKAPCDRRAEPVEFQNGLTEPRGEEILVKDLASSQYCVMTAVRVPLTDGQFAALTDFVFNVGSGNFRSSKLLARVNAKEQDLVPWELRRWVKADGKPLPALQTRREREIGLFLEGLPNTKGVPPAGEDFSPVDIRQGDQR
jgi:lysozyme